MKNELIEHWSMSADNYSKIVQEGMSCSYENRRWQEVFTDALGEEKMSILDVGTGPGVVAFQLTQLGHTVIGIDLSDEMLKEARKNALLYGLDIRFEKADTESLPFPDSTFDAVVSKYLLWTVPDPEKALREWLRVVKPGGKIVYVDGNWVTDLESSWFRRRWCDLANMYFRITDENGAKKRPEGDVRSHLWSTHADRPGKDIEMMRAADYVRIESRFIPYRRILRGMRRFKYGMYKGNFILMGYKKD